MLQRVPPWARVAFAMFGIGWGANQFVSMLIAYRQFAGVTVATSQALFGVYAVGLIAALLLGGPVSDRRGRIVLTIPAAAVSVLATLALMAGAHHLSLLYLGRLLAGLASGAAFAAGTSWVKELSLPPHDDDAGEQAGARRAAIALSAGFGLGPVVAGVIAQWAPRPLVLPYVGHLVVMAVAIPLVLSAPETVLASSATTRRLIPAGVRSPRFLGVVTPSAPWTFLAPAAAFAVLPGLVAAHTHGLAIAFSALSAGLTLGMGVLIQPVARRLDRPGGVRGATLGLVGCVAGFALATIAAHTGSPAYAIAAVFPLGIGYGCCLVSGLLETQRLAQPEELASMTAVFYALTYLGFAAPFVYAEANRALSYPALLALTAVLAAASLGTVRWRSAVTAETTARPRPAASNRAG